MTDHANAELIAASETWTPAEVHASPVGAARIIESLAAALEAVEQRAKEAERELQVAEDQANNLAGDLAQAEKERDEARKAAEDHVLDADAVHVRLSAELRAAEKRADAWKGLCESTEAATRALCDERDRLDEALREAYADLQAYTDSGAPFGHRPVEEFLLHRADRIEREAGQ